MSRQCLQPKTPHKAAAGWDNNRLSDSGGVNGSQEQVSSPICCKCCTAEQDKTRCITTPNRGQPTQIFSSLCNNCPYNKASVKPNWFSTQSSILSYCRHSCTSFSSTSSLQRKNTADFKIYEGGDLLKFFTRNCEPKRVSEVCLVNDHYILVKMPDPCCRRSTEIESISNELVELSNKGTSIRMGSKHTHSSWPPITNTPTNNSPTMGYPCPLAKYLQGKRTHRVSPVRPRNMQLIDLTNKKKTVPETRPTIEQEVFRGHSRIKKIAVESSAIQEAPLDLSVKRSKLVTPRRTETTTETRTEHNTISLKSSVHNDVVLEQHGLMRLASDLPNIDEEEACTPATLSTRGNAAGGGGPLRWLIRPFRRRTKPMVKTKPKPKKSKPHVSKVQAVVYKTYFVSWKPPPTVEPKPKGSLRRCRSALF